MPNSVQQKPVRLWVPGSVKGAARHRNRVVSRIRRGMSDREILSLVRSGKSHFSTTYRGKEDQDWRAAVMAVAARFGNPKTCLFDGPVFVGMRINLLRPKDHYVAGDRGRGLKASAPARYTCTKKPDNDNSEKAVWDTLGKSERFPNGLFYSDDSGVAANWVDKVWADPPIQAGALVVVAPAEIEDRQKLVDLLYLESSTLAMAST